MAKPLNVEALLEQVRQSLQGTAKNAMHRLWGPEGPPWGTSFEDLEELAVQIGRVLAKEVLEQSVSAQAKADPPPASSLCPACGRPCTAKAPEPHVVESRAGQVCWPQPSSTCGHCRKAFFPSGQGAGH
jgi:hypothetical protein